MNQAILINTLTILLFVVFVGFLYYKGKEAEAKKIILALVIKAEKSIVGEKKGGERYKFVSERIYPLLPKIVRIIITEADVDELIEEAVEKLKDYLEE